MAERSFADEVKKLRLGAGEVFRGEGILAVTKALLESGVAYVSGYQGAPISHLMELARDQLAGLGQQRGQVVIDESLSGRRHVRIVHFAVFTRLARIHDFR